jgi:hypothetical protein
MPSGGYRAPAQPAPVAGPGSLSKRTDGGPADKQPIRDLPNAGYGQQAEFRGIQQGAPIQKAGSPSSQAAAISAPLPLDAPSARPDEPITSGANAGAGPTQETLGLFNPEDLAANDAAYLLRYLPTLQHIVDSTPGVNTSTLALVRWLRSQV